MAVNIAKWQHEQGSTKLTGYSGAELEMQSGSKFDQQSGSSATLAGTNSVTGTLTKASTGKLIYSGYTTHASTADGQLNNWGHSYIKPASSTGHFRVKAPTAGCDKYITVATSKVCIVSVTTASGQTSPYIGTLSTQAVTIMKVHCAPDKAASRGVTIHLRGMTTVRWFPISVPSTVSCSLSTST
jgi:hypothetical protein